MSKYKKYNKEFKLQAARLVAAPIFFKKRYLSLLASKIIRPCLRSFGEEQWGMVRGVSEDE